MTLSLSPEKSLKLEKQFLIFCPSPKVAPKPTGQSSSHSISMAPLQISAAHFFVYDIPSKLRVVHIKKFLILIFSKNGSNDFHQILWVYCTFEPQQYSTFDFSQKYPCNQNNIFLIFYLSPNVAPKPNGQSCSDSISTVLLQLSPARPFHFRPTLNIKDILMLRVVHIRNRNGMTNMEFYKHDQLFLMLCY